MSGFTVPDNPYKLTYSEGTPFLKLYKDINVDAGRTINTEADVLNWLKGLSPSSDFQGKKIEEIAYQLKLEGTARKFGTVRMDILRLLSNSGKIKVEEFVVFLKQVRFREYADASIKIDNGKKFIEHREYTTYIEGVSRLGYSKEEAEWLVYDYINFKTGEKDCVKIYAEEDWKARCLELEQELADTKADLSRRTVSDNQRLIKAEKKARFYYQCNVILTILLFICASLALFFANSAVSLKKAEPYSLSDERIAEVQQEATQKILDAEKRIAETETASQKKISDAEKIKNDAIRQAEQSVQTLVAQKTKELQHNFDVQVATLKTKENDLDRRIKENDNTRKTIKSEKEKFESEQKEFANDKKQKEEQIRKTQQELTVTLKGQQEAIAKAKQSEEEWAKRLNGADIDFSAFNHFVRNKNTIGTGYWYWRGINTDNEPLLGAAKIIGISDSRVHLENTNKQKFSVYIRSLTKEQQALIGLLYPKEFSRLMNNGFP